MAGKDDRDSRVALPQEYNSEDAVAFLHDYHELSKHGFEAYAPGPETLDWDNQPNPFRDFAGSDGYPLPLLAQGGGPSWGTVLAGQREAEAITPQTVSRYLQLSLGLTAWKQWGPDRWSLRANPSSGNLHPTEAYVLLGGESGLPRGLCHYNVAQHALEQRVVYDTGDWPQQSFGVALTSVLWRELWKYGERGFRYTQLDVGHAVAALAYAAQAHGWQVVLMSGVSTQTLSHLLGLQRPEYTSVEREYAECLLWVGANLQEKHLPDFETQPQPLADWQGTPSKLMQERSLYHWPLANQAMLASETSVVPSAQRLPHTLLRTSSSAHPSVADLPVSFQEVVYGRRSAVAFKQETMDRPRFDAILSALFYFQTPLSGHTVDYIVAVHRVEGLEPGLYAMPAHLDSLSRLQKCCCRWSDWQQVSHYGEAALPLYRLEAARVQQLMATLCCHQAIAADSAFTIGFIADIKHSSEQAGAAAYRQLHWQSGFLSHQIYLAASALNVAATGIGCFFDDPWLQWLGSGPGGMQMLYLTAVGTPRKDERVTTLSGYHYLDRDVC